MISREKRLQWVLPTHLLCELGRLCSVDAMDSDMGVEMDTDLVGGILNSYMSFILQNI